MGYKIVHVDDDPTILRVVAKAFEMAGHKVVSIPEAEAAAGRIRNEKPDLLICDINMPQVDGFQLVGQLRAGPDPVNVPVIFFSAVGGDEVVCRAFELGAIDFVRKPASLVELQARVDARLAARSQGSSKSDLRGTLALMSVADLLTAAENAKKSAVLTIRSKNQLGEIRLRSGKIVDAWTGSLKGEDALYRLVMLQDGEFEMRLGSDGDAPGPLDLQPQFALIEAARLKDEGRL